MTLFGKIERRLTPLFSRQTVDGIAFHNIRRTRSLTHSVGFSESHIIKIEHEVNSRKLNSLAGEVEIIRSLNSKGCVSCPALVASGQLPDGSPYLIQERIKAKGTPRQADMLLALLEQKQLGIYQGDFKPENMIFDGDICYLIDYDQAQRDDQFSEMGNVEFIEWIANDFQERRGHEFFSDPSRQFDKQGMLDLFLNDSFNLGETALLQRQKTTNTATGFYHKVQDKRVFINGARDLSDRKPMLDRVPFDSAEKVLDVGCNLGLLSQYLAGRGCDVTGIDLDKNVIRAARIVANIMGIDANFVCADAGSMLEVDNYETVCLFSVLHHIQDMDNAIAEIGRSCNRLVLECKLHEVGSRPTRFGWKRTNGWKFETVEELIAYLESKFEGFQLKENYGQVDRDRFVLSLVKA